MEKLIQTIFASHFVIVFDALFGITVIWGDFFRCAATKCFLERYFGFAQKDYPAIAEILIVI